MLSHDAEVKALRRALGDIAALSSLPAIWLDADEQQISESLAQALLRVLDLDGVWIRLTVEAGADAEAGAPSARAPGDLRAQLMAAFPEGEEPWPGPRAMGTLGLRGLCMGIGLSGGGGRLYAAAARPDFPSETERLALVMAANQAAIACHRAAAERALRQQTAALNRERDAVALLNQSLAKESDRLRQMFEQAPGFMAVLRGPTHVFELCNQSYIRLIGEREVLGRSAREVFPELEGQGFFDLLADVYTSGTPHVSVAAPIDLYRTPGGQLERRYVDFIYQPIFDAEGRVTAIFAEGHDVTEERRAAEHRQFLVNELNHRVKNTLATVQSMAHQTLRGVGDLREEKALLTARLVALSNAHNVLTREDWTGADLAEVVADSIRPHDDPQEPRVTAGGPALRLDARAALALSMALHELATNAVKYGALSNDAGRVAIHWRRAGQGAATIEWRESGGPRIEAPPPRQGFGSRLLKAGLAVEMGAAAELHYAPDGLVCRIVAPVSGVRYAAQPGPEAAARPADTADQAVLNLDGAPAA
jgi:two-component sensor histidine kinase/PAS domain-containing protein